MTREEAIERLKTDIYKYADFKENPNENEFWTAFDIAIKALEQEPCKVGTELAHWIDNHNGTISCSHCNTWFHKDDRYSYMRYCPYCTVKMAESEE